MAATRVNSFNEAGQGTAQMPSFKSGVTRPGIETPLPALVARAQLTVRVVRFIDVVAKTILNYRNSAIST